MVVLALVLVVLAAVGGLPQYFRRFRGRSHRLLYATARDLRVPLVTKDEALRGFAQSTGDITVIW